MKPYILLFLLVVLLVGCKKNNGNISSSSVGCSLPSGTTVSANGRYIEGAVTVPLGNGSSSQFILHTQRVEKFDAYNWGTRPLSTYPSNGQSPCETHLLIAGMWKEYYQDMVDFGIHPSVIQYHVSSISNQSNTEARALSGVYAEEYFSFCGYAGAAGTIYCGLDASEGTKQYFLSHENTHGFQWDMTKLDANENITFYRIFAHFTNSMYHLSKTNPDQLISADGLWYVDLASYGFQNEAEWLADMFKDYLYTDKYHWAYIKRNVPVLKSFFDCLWKEGKNFTQCQSTYNVPMVALAQTTPFSNQPTPQGFSVGESDAIWNTCFQRTDQASYESAFDQMTERLAPGLYSGSAASYKLGYGDCNHDGVIDWVCNYKGLSPNGGSYFWNSQNKIGAYGFIVSGKSGESYADYRQDPFHEGQQTLVQPMYREWEGTYGSCNGAQYFSNVPDRFPFFANDVVDLPADLVNKTTW